jgi:hypothetical protein
MLDFRDIWAVLEISRSGRSVLIQYEDGLFCRAAQETYFSDTIVVRREIAEAVTRLVQSLPEGRPGMRNDGPIPMPVFVRVTDSGGRESTWSQLVRLLRFPGVSSERLQFVHLTDRAPRARAPFRLPFNVLTLGNSELFGLRPLLQRPWFRSSPIVRERGIRIRQTSRLHLADSFAATRQDILFVSELHSVFAYRAIRNLSPSHRPRLVVDHSPEITEIPEGVSVLHAAGDRDQGSLGTEVLFALIHDLPLHEMLRVVERRSKPNAKFSLYSNPSTNHELRILDAYQNLRRQLTGYQSLMTVFGLRAEQLATSVPPGLARTLEMHSEKTLAVGEAATRSLASVSSFDRETTGLLPLLRAERQLESVQEAWKPFQNRLSRLHHHKALRERLGQQQRRTVGIALERLETRPYGSTVSPETTLQAGARYEVRIHIGNSLPGNLIKQRIPSIDLLLPPSKVSTGHNLTIAIQQKEFLLLSSASHTLFLPQLGGSKLVYFELRASRTTGPATFRVLVYYGNQLLQAFLFKSVVTPVEEQRRDSPTEVELEFSQTSRFANLDDLKPRALSIVANDNLNGTHEFFLRGETIGKAPLGDDAYVRATEEFREILKKASLEPGSAEQARSFPPTKPGEPASSVASDFLRQLANKGHDTYQGMFTDLPEETPLPPAISSLRNPSNDGTTVQIVRISKRLVIPWSLLYDYDLPETHTGAFCLGFTRDGNGNACPCAHGPTDKVYCIRGFWGARLIIEERIANGPDDHGVVSIPVPSESEPLCVAMDMSVDGVPTLYEQFKDGIGEKKVAGPLDSSALLTLLWQDPPKRPAVLVVLGHLETQPPQFQGEPAGDRIVLVQNKSWLTRESISDRCTVEPRHWTQPRPLVLLMACSVAATTVSKLNDFVLALNRAGAGAIVGTECVVFADLVCSFAKYLTLAMWRVKDKQHVSLGQAMREYRITTLQEGNPLAFVFRAIGNADLILET